MKLIESKAEYIPQQEGLDGIYKQIELCGRTCYKSEDKITEDSAKGFVDRMIESNHTAMLEHGTVYLIHLFSGDINEELTSPLYKYKFNKHSKYVSEQDKQMINLYNHSIYVTTNLRVLVENNWLEDLKYICEPTVHHEKRYTMRFTTDRGVSHELVRHRVFSFAQESTRYCNYSKDKFERELTFIIPEWVNIPEGRAYWYDGINYRVGVTGDNVMGLSINPTSLGDEKKAIQYDLFLHSLDTAEHDYIHLIGKGCNAQQARQVLPNALKTEICMTGFASDWAHFFDLRLFGKTGAPHPDMKQLTEKAKKALQDAKVWEEIYKNT